MCVLVWLAVVHLMKSNEVLLTPTAEIPDNCCSLRLNPLRRVQPPTPEWLDKGNGLLNITFARAEQEVVEEMVNTKKGSQGRFATAVNPLIPIHR